MFFRVPFLVQFLFRRRIWRGKDANAVYLTFDDGPDRYTTPWVLDLLKRENIKATFFCIGQNIENNPSLFNDILENGHSIGNHTFNHEKGTVSHIVNDMASFQDLFNLVGMDEVKEMEERYSVDKKTRVNF